MGDTILPKQYFGSLGARNFCETFPDRPGKKIKHSRPLALPVQRTALEALSYANGGLAALGAKREQPGPHVWLVATAKAMGDNSYSDKQCNNVPMSAYSIAAIAVGA